MWFVECVVFPCSIFRLHWNSAQCKSSSQSTCECHEFKRFYHCLCMTLYNHDVDGSLNRGERFVHQNVQNISVDHVLYDPL